MVATRNSEPRVLDDALRNAVIENFTREELRRIGNGGGTSNMEGSYGRLTKVDFPKFNRDVNGWLELVESYAVSLFIGILKNEISMPVRMQEATLALTKTKSVLQLCSSNDSTNGTMKSGFRKQPRYVPGHKCPGQMYSLEVSVDDCE
ncbi:hypothetical protein Tco_1072444 [Tanacetum coccineum]